MSFKDQLVAKTRSGKLTADELSDSNTLSDDIFTDDEPALTGFTKQDEDFDPSDLLETQDIDELEKLAYTEAPPVAHEYGLDIDETPVEPEEPYVAPQPAVVAHQPEQQVAQISYSTPVVQEPEPEPYAPPVVTAPIYTPPAPAPVPEPAPYVTPYSQPEPAPSYAPEPQPQPYVEHQSIEEPTGESKLQSETASLLLDYAKSHIMLDIATSFTSAIFSKEAVTNLINAYNGKANAQSYSNANALICSLLDEVVESDYKKDHYGDITKDVIAAIKEDLA